jgi:hypothetical protein
MVAVPTIPVASNAVCGPAAAEAVRRHATTMRRLRHDSRMTRRPRLRSPLPAARAVAVILALALFGASACSDARTQSQLDLANPGYDPTVVVILAPDGLRSAINALDTAYTTANPGVSFVLVTDVVTALRRTTHRRRLLPSNDDARTALTADLAPNIWIDANSTISGLLPKTAKSYGSRDLFGYASIRLVVARGNPKGIQGLSVFEAGSGLKTGLCTSTTGCGVLGRDALVRAHVHAKPTISARTSYTLITALERGKLDAVLAMSPDAANAGSHTSTVAFSPAPARFIPYSTLRLDQSPLAAAYATWIVHSPVAERILAAYGFVRKPPAAP